MRPSRFFDDDYNLIAKRPPGSEVGRPTHLPEPSQCRQIEAMAGYGVPEADIARVLDFDPKTLREHYWDESDAGHGVANAKVAESLFR